MKKLISCELYEEELRTIHNALIFYKTHPQFGNSVGDSVADTQRIKQIQHLANDIRDLIPPV